MYLCLHDVYPLLALLVLILEGVILWRWRRILTANTEVDLKIIQTLFYFISVFYAYLFLNDISIVIMSADRLSEAISFLIVASLAPICIGTLLMWSEAAEQIPSTGSMATASSTGSSNISHMCFSER